MTEETSSPLNENLGQICLRVHDQSENNIVYYEVNEAGLLMLWPGALCEVCDTSCLGTDGTPWMNFNISTEEILEEFAKMSWIQPRQKLDSIVWSEKHGAATCLNCDQN